MKTIGISGSVVTLMSDYQRGKAALRVVKQLVADIGGEIRVTMTGPEGRVNVTFCMDGEKILVTAAPKTSDDIVMTALGGEHRGQSVRVASLSEYVKAVAS
jgi:hypothetical protein